MCELFALNATCPVDVREYLKIFYSHCDKHPNGWGLAYTHDDEVIFYKEALKASDSNLLNDILSTEFTTRHLLAHIRLATIGDMNISNCHPFELTDNTNRKWTLIHNGTIFDYHPLDKYKNIQSGNTDSERILYYIVECVNNLADEDKFDDDKLSELINNIICKLSKNNKVNLILYNGQLLFIHSNCKKSLYLLDKKDYVLISTLALNDENWQEVDINTLYTIKDSTTIYKSNSHENEYIISEENIQFILDNLSDEALKKLIQSYGSIDKIKKQIMNDSVK